MTEVHYPVLKLCPSNRNGKNVVLAAIGSSIQSFSASNGIQLSSWPRDGNEDTSEEDEFMDGRPSKKLKLENGQPATLVQQESGASEDSINIKTEGKQRQKGERRRPKIPDTKLSNVSHLITTRDGKHAVAITVEDKAVRVFRVSDRGRLRLLSSRPMPKKSCAIILSHDEKTVLTADKFGDVYSLPLHPKLDYERKDETPIPETIFQPSASELTVHTKGNLEALQQQKLQKQKHPKKEGPNFEHKLLLGHVSLLTDLALAWGAVDGKQRPFVLSADRDEHIRVSRGIPQTHVLHSFCLGHTEFVSKLCVLPWDQRILIAGNGEPSLRVYDWQKGEQHSRFDLVQQLRSDIETSLATDRSVEKLAVSGIWPIIYQDRKTILVALEGLPLLFAFVVLEHGLHHTTSIKLDGNVLDVVQLQDTNRIAVSVDTVHDIGSYKAFRSSGTVRDVRGVQILDLTPVETVVGGSIIQALSIQSSFKQMSLQIEPVLFTSASAKSKGGEDEATPKIFVKTYSELGEFVYGLENLRKRRGNAAEEADEEGQVEGNELEGAPSIN